VGRPVRLLAGRDGEYEQVITMLAEGIADRRGRTGAFLHRDRVHGMLRARRGARLTAITFGWRSRISPIEWL
jgi:ATP-dependent Lhr-like helicase